VTVPAAQGPTFGPGPSGPFEATVNKPYLGTSVAGKYAPTASDPVDGDLSAAIKTYLVSNNTLISLSGSKAYIFPVGSTQIRNTVTNSRGVSAEQTVTIVVVGPKPLLEVKDTSITVTQPANENLKTVRYADGVSCCCGASGPPWLAQPDGPDRSRAPILLAWGRSANPSP
jgi:hypothetical protein